MSYSVKTRKMAVEMYERGCPMLSIEAKTGASANTIRRWAVDAGAELRPAHGVTKAVDVDELWDAWVKIGSISGAARSLGIPYGTAYHYLGNRKQR